MKVKNKLLNRIATVGMLAVVLLGGFWSLGVSNSYAIDKSKYSFLSSSYDYGYYNAGNYYLYSFIGESNKVVSFFNRPYSNHFQFMRLMISSSPISGTRNTRYFSIKSDGSYSETSSSFNFEHQGSVTYNGTKYYYYAESSSTSGDYIPEWFGHLGTFYNCHITYQEWNNLKLGNLVLEYVSGSLDSSSFTMVTEDEDISTDETTWPGSRENPLENTKIGTLKLDRSKCYYTEGGNTPTVQRISWKNKTDTGFSLNNNDYALTRIEVKIGNRVTYYGDVEHHGQGKKIDNFGKVYSFKYVNPKDNPYDFSFTEMLSASQTDLGKYNPAMLEHEYDLYFRVVCADAIGTSAKYYVGNWTRYRCTDDPKQKGDNESDDGHFNEDGEWEKDKDTDVDSGGIGIVKDDEDKEDDFKNFTDSESWKDWLNEGGLDLDSAVSFISQISEVPKMIGDLFSFLPKWVQYSFALGFGLIPVIIVIKFLRG